MEDIVSYLCMYIIPELNGGNENAVISACKIRYQRNWPETEMRAFIVKGLYLLFHLVSNHNFLFGLC